MVAMHSNKGFKLLVLAVFLMQFGGAAGSIGVPILAKKVFQTSFWGLAMLGVIGALVYSLVCFAMGDLSKRANPYKMMLLGTSAYAATFTLAVFATATWHLILVYIFAGGATAFFWPMVEAAMAHGTTGQIQNRRIGIFNVSWSLADALGTAAAGGLYLIWPRLPFVVLITAMMAVLVITLIAYGLAETEERPPGENTPEKTAPGRPIPQETKQNYARAAWCSNFFAHGVTNVLRSVFAAPAVDVFKMSPLTIGLIVGAFNATRTITFAVLRRSSAWTYRSSVLTGANLLLISGMASVVGAAYFAPADFAVGIVYFAMILSGLGCGIIYYSSIYYSINLSSLVASNTRIHEAFLGAGAATVVLASGGLHSLVSSPLAGRILLRFGLDQFAVSSLAPFILAATAAGLALGVSRRLRK